MARIIEVTVSPQGEATVQTKGCVAYARAMLSQLGLPDAVLRDLLTLVCWVLDRLCNHSLHDCDISIQCTANKARKQGDPVRLGNAEEKT